MKALCIRHDPVARDQVASLGYGGIGALIAFRHGCPNNAPRILHRKRRDSWSPLFPKRVTAAAGGAFGNRENDQTTISARLARLGDDKMIENPWLFNTTDQGRAMIFLLAALRSGPRFDEVLADKTGLTLPEVRAWVALAEAYSWVDAKRRLTDSGRSQLAHPNISPAQYGRLLPEPHLPYYPKSLRAPRDV
jgi:hypothetical protein